MAARQWRAASDCFTLALHALGHGSAAAPLNRPSPSPGPNPTVGGGAAVVGCAGLLSGRAEARLHLRLPTAALRDCDAALALQPEHAASTSRRRRALRAIGGHHVTEGEGDASDADADAAARIHADAAPPDAALLLEQGADALRRELRSETLALAPALA